MNPFWFAGGALALWAVILTFVLGLRNEGFPRVRGQERIVMAISVVLALAAIGTAIYAGAASLDDKGVRHGKEIEHG